MSVMAMLLSMLLYFPGGMLSLDFGLKASAATITPSQPIGKGTSDSPYNIRTATELYWFAACINGTDGVTQNKSACAKLTANITVNSNLLSLLKYDTGGNVTNSDSFTSWTPIGNNSNQYTGTFDGQNYTIRGLYFNDTSTDYVGLFGYIGSGSAVKNVGVVDSYFKGSASVGGVCGYNNSGTIENCYNTGAVIATSGDTAVGGVCGSNNGRNNTGTVIATGDDTDVGGVCGYNNRPITNCYNTGAVNATGTRTCVGGVCGKNYYTIRNCYYDRDKYSGNAVASNSGTVNDVEGKATARFKSGEVAYLLQSGQTADDSGNIPEVWGQDLSKDDYPVLGGTKVYATTGCVTYNNGGNTAEKEHNYTFTADKHSCIDCGLTENHNFGEDNICTVCNTYTISTADQLYWFAGLVNGTLEGVTQDTYVNAVLMADITVNTGDVANCGGVKADGWTDWTPIGESPVYSGTFDGQGHTISGLYLNDPSSYNVGLFGEINGTVKNVGVVNCYFNCKLNVGGVCGNNYNGTITNCYNTGTVSGSGSVGGVCGYNMHTITNCYNTGTVSATGDKTGGVCGYNRAATITNCYNTGTVNGTGEVGGVCGYNHSVASSTSEITNCYNTGTVSGTGNYIGGVCGRNGSTITNCYYDREKYTGNAVGGSSGTLDKVEGKTTKQFNIGEVAYLLNGSTSEGTLVWGQTIGTEKSPVLGGAKVYQVDSYAGCKGNPGNASTGYSNTNAPVYAEHSMTAYPANAATCTKAGNYAYWTCSNENGVYYKNAAGTDTFANLSATVIPALGHNMTEFKAKDPTCTADGNYAYWTCSHENGVYYKDAEGTDTFASLSATVIPALEHDDTDNDGYCNNGCGKLIHSVVKEVSATLDGDIGLNYYIALPESVTSDTGAYVQFTVNGQNTKVFVKDVTAEENGTYKFTCWLTAKEMRDDITFELFDGSGTNVDIYKNSGDKIEGAGFDYSLETYLNTLSSDESGENVALKDLADATLVYGAYAQNAFNHNANSNLNGSELADVTVGTLETNRITKSSDIPEGLKLTEMTLILETETTLRLYFRSDNIGNYTFKLDGAVVTLNTIAEEELYYVEIANISAKDLDTMHTLEINGECTLTFNALSYAYATVKADTNENICNVVKALYKYNDAANTYFGE